MKGYLIAVEGVEGSGKTLQSKGCAEYFVARGLPAMIAKELNDTELGQRIRRVLLDEEGMRISPLAVISLFEAARQQLVTEKIKPALAEGTSVIVPGYLLSTELYQGFGDYFGSWEKLRMIRDQNHLASENCFPDMTFVLDQSAEVAMQHASKKNKAYVFRTQRDLSYYKRLEEGSATIAYKYWEKGALFVPRGPIEDVRAKIVACLDAVLLSGGLPEGEILENGGKSERQQAIHRRVFEYQKK